MKATKTVKVPLGLQLFNAVQGYQGHAFVSDSIEFATDAEVMKMAETALHFTNLTAKELRAFIRRRAARKAGRK